MQCCVGIGPLNVPAVLYPGIFQTTVFVCVQCGLDTLRRDLFWVRVVSMSISLNDVNSFAFIEKTELKELNQKQKLRFKQESLGTSYSLKSDFP